MPILSWGRPPNTGVARRTGWVTDSKTDSDVVDRPHLVDVKMPFGIPDGVR